MNFKELQQQKIAQLKTDIGYLLSQTDWVVTRKFERSIEIPEIIVLERQSIRDVCDRIESEILDLTTIEEVENYQIIL